MQIGNLKIPKAAALAPMAGVADRAFREICAQWGAVYVVGEMVSAKGLSYQSEKSAQLLELGDQPHLCPQGIQLFGDEPETMAQAAKTALGYRPHIIDINMGCPAPKIAGGGSGSALMKNLPLAGEIIAAVVEAAGNVPVTVKFRKGWDETMVNVVEAAQLAQRMGAAAVTVHGRTRKQMYAPPVDLDSIRAVKQAVSIPVIGNGDVDSPQSAMEMYTHTGVDLVMVGRGALGAPWVFRQIAAWMEQGILLPDPKPEEKMQVLLQHIRLSCSYKGEHRAMREARTHAAHYFKGWHGAAELRRRSGKLETYTDLEALVDYAFKTVEQPNSGITDATV